MQGQKAVPFTHLSTFPNATPLTGHNKKEKTRQPLQQHSEEHHALSQGSALLNCVTTDWRSMIEVGSNGGFPASASSWLQQKGVFVMHTTDSVWVWCENGSHTVKL